VWGETLCDITKKICLSTCVEIECRLIEKDDEALAVFLAYLREPDKK